MLWEIRCIRKLLADFHPDGIEHRPAAYLLCFARCEGIQGLTVQTFKGARRPQGPWEDIYGYCGLQRDAAQFIAKAYDRSIVNVQAGGVPGKSSSEPPRMQIWASA